MLISSRKNDSVRLFRELSRDKKMRDEAGLFSAEGDHLCGELARCGYEVTLALCTEKAREKYPETVALLLERAAESAVITEEVAEYISDTKAPQGIFAVARKKPLSADVGVMKRVVILDGVQDPGNVGTIIRTAEALSLDAAVLSEACADVFSPKTLRASMGSALRLPCITGGLSEMISTLKSEGFSVFGAMLDESAQRLGELSFPERAAVVIGSEGAGISEEVRALCTSAVYIPITGAESLNAGAAAAIILWELSR